MVKTNTLQFLTFTTLLSFSLAQNSQSVAKNSNQAQATSVDAQNASPSSSAPTQSAPVSARDQCLLNCGAGNVSCQAGCDGLPNPSQDDAKASINCVNECNSNPDLRKDMSALLSCFQKCNKPSTSSNSSSDSNSDSSAPKPSGSGSAKPGKNSTNSTSSNNSSNSEGSHVYFLSTSILSLVSVIAFSNI